MRSKEEFYEDFVLKTREMLSNPKNLKCTCPKVNCEWHGNCEACVAIHRYYKDHLPNCFQQIVNEKIEAIAGIGELEVKEKQKTPSEYWDYVKKQDKNKVIKP